jgi:hypothetical protein
VYDGKVHHNAQAVSTANSMEIHLPDLPSGRSTDMEKIDSIAPSEFYSRSSSLSIKTQPKHQSTLQPMQLLAGENINGGEFNITINTIVTSL